MPVNNPGLKREKMARQMGFGSSLELNLQPKRQWYKEDGTPLPNLLPVDPYHLEVYSAKGWTLKAPTVPVLPKASEDFVGATEEEVLKAQGFEIPEDVEVPEGLTLSEVIAPADETGALVQPLKEEEGDSEEDE